MKSLSTYVNEAFSINEDKKIAAKINYTGYVPVKLSMKEFVSTDDSSLYNNPTEAIASMVWSPYNKIEEHKYRLLYDKVKSYLTTDNKAKAFAEKVQNSYPKGKAMQIPNNILSFVADTVFHIDKETNWLKEYAYHMLGASKDSAFALKEFEKTIKDVKSYLQKMSNRTTWVVNPGFQGITSSTERGKQQHIEVKSLNLIDKIVDLLNISYRKGEFEQTTKNIDKILSYNTQEVNSLLDKANYYSKLNDIIK